MTILVAKPISPSNGSFQTSKISLNFFQIYNSIEMQDPDCRF